jgi:RimJ/RimL family protein N-acetyltransferase
MSTRLLIGPRVRLTALGESDLPAIVPWWSNDEFVRLASDDPAVPQTVETLKQWFLSDDRWKITLGIRLNDGGELLGFLKIRVVSWPHRTGDISLGIGEPSRWGQGYGAEAIRLGIDLSFRELNLHRLQLGVFSYNERAIRLYEKLGFTREGRLRESLQRDGRWHDTVLFGLLAREWPTGGVPDVAAGALAGTRPAPPA